MKHSYIYQTSAFGSSLIEAMAICCVQGKLMKKNAQNQNDGNFSPAALIFII